MATDPQDKNIASAMSSQSWGIRFAIACGIAICLVSFTKIFAGSHWIASLLSSFTVQYVLLLIPISAACLIRRRWWWGTLFIATLSIQLATIQPYFFPGKSDPLAGNEGSPSTFRLFVQNVQIDNHQHQRLIELIHQENPDAILLLETDERWIQALKTLHTSYPYYKEVPFQGAFGISILSKTAWESCEVLESGPDQLPVTVTQWGKGIKRITLIGTHPFPPISSGKAVSRNTQLQENIRLLEARSGAYEGTKILAGDFNLTPWSPCFQTLLIDPYLEHGGYRLPDQIASKNKTFQDAAEGYNLWPTWYLFPTLLGGVKIDHVLIHSDQNVMNYRVGPNIGSDHRAVIVDLAN